MRELINLNGTGEIARRNLLLGVSTFALIGYVSLVDAVFAQEPTDRPTVWIEIGGQLERLDGGQEQFSPAFLDSLKGLPLPSALSIQKAPRYTNGAEGSISFRPSDSEWIIAASIRYGRANGSKRLHEQTPNLPLTKLCIGPTLCVHRSTNTTAVPSAFNKKRANFIDATFQQAESHVVADFSAGKDVGLGIFGGSPTTLSAGIRFAQFTSKTTHTMNAIPDRYAPTNVLLHKYDHRYDAAARIERSFSGIGPSLSLTGSTPISGTVEEGRFTFDWGVNAAVLFGRQKTKIDHQTTKRFYMSTGQGKYPLQYSKSQSSTHQNRLRSVIVPNVGGFAGISVRYTNLKVSLGYRADFFFGAMDGGIDARKTYDHDFYGPFATISIGLP